MPTPSGTARLVERLEITSTLAIFRFALDGGVPDFLPGQFLTIGLPQHEAGGRPTWRAYSIASPPHEKRWIELFVREALEPVPGRLTPLMFSMSPGETLPHRGITGAFTIAARPDGSPETRSLLCVASGTGVSPFVSYAESLWHDGVPRGMVLAHGSRIPAELGYLRRLREIENSPGPFRLRYVPTISRPHEAASAGWPGETGRVETLLQRPAGGGISRLEELIGEELTPSRWFAHACGFDATVRAALEQLHERGFLSRRERRPDGSFDLLTESFG